MSSSDELRGNELPDLFKIIACSQYRNPQFGEKKEFMVLG
jgi:hypothetical protein